MKRLAMVMLVLGCVFSPRPAGAVLLTFDDLALGDYGNSLSYGGVTFSTYSTSHLQITGLETDRGYGNEYSLPYKLSVSGEARVLPEETSFQLLFDHPSQDINFWLTGTFHDTTINAYNEGGQLVSSFLQTYPQPTPLSPDGTPWDFYYDRALTEINVNGAGITKLTIQPTDYDGFSIDNVSYRPPVVPEPATLLLLGPALGGMVWGRRRRKV